MRRCARDGVPWPRTKEKRFLGRHEVTTIGDVLEARCRNCVPYEENKNISRRQASFYRTDQVRLWHKAVVKNLRDASGSKRRGVCSGKPWPSWDQQNYCRWQFRDSFAVCTKNTHPPPAPSKCVRFVFFDGHDPSVNS